MIFVNLKEKNNIFVLLLEKTEKCLVFLVIILKSKSLKVCITMNCSVIKKLHNVTRIFIKMSNTNLRRRNGRSFSRNQRKRLMVNRTKEEFNSLDKAKARERLTKVFVLFIPLYIIALFRIFLFLLTSPKIKQKT